ncbi:hypothetical protein [Pseudomonas sp. FW300-N1A1]|nr:hypothetical protein [Pseudomonas sp. FW300-N1A1]
MTLRVNVIGRHVTERHRRANGRAGAGNASHFVDDNFTPGDLRKLGTR